jgi:hypothetical protein
MGRSTPEIGRQTPNMKDLQTMTSNSAAQGRVWRHLHREENQPMESTFRIAKPLRLGRKFLPKHADAAGRPAQAGPDLGERARAVILLSWAVFSAEQFAAGQAVRVVCEDEKEQPSYTVRVARSGEHAEVRVDRLKRRMYLVSPFIPAARDGPA